MRCNRTTIYTFILPLLLVLLLPGCIPGCLAGSGGSGFHSPYAEADDGEWVNVTRIVDGDTIEVTGERKVRYIGMDTPETKHPSKGKEPYGEEATAANTRLVEGKRVMLVKDVSETDRYDRLLRYVFLEDGTFVNLKLVEYGYARVSTFPPDVRFADVFLEAERIARAANRGLWGLDDDAT